MKRKSDALIPPELAIPERMETYLRKSLEDAIAVNSGGMAPASAISGALYNTVVESRRINTSIVKENEVVLRKHVHRDCQSLATALNVGGWPLTRIEAIVSDDMSLDARVSSLDAFLREFEGRRTKNLATFDAITSHHHALVGDYSGGTQSVEQLRKYATAAVEMGTKAWVKAGMEWMEKQMGAYYFDGGAKRQYVKAVRRKAVNVRGVRETELTTDIACMAADALPHLRMGGKGSPVLMLDIGSCYNPFRDGAMRDDLDVTALDLYPSKPFVDGGVYACDFLDIDVGDSGSALACSAPTPEGTVVLQRLPAGYFDAASISLVLSYLPRPEQRIDMIRKARTLLCEGTASSPHRRGLLLIMEKLSVLGGNGAKKKHGVDASAPLTHWKEQIVKCGFRLVTYQLQGRGAGRFHCFAFAVDPDATVDTSGSLKLMTKSEMGI